LHPRQLLSLQDVSCQPRNTPPEQRKFEKRCRFAGQPLPDHCVLDVLVGGQPFDVVWNMGANRIGMLAYMDTPLAVQTARPGDARNERIRSLAGWAASRERSGHLYDRRVYCATSYPATIEQLKALESGKITILNLQEDGWDRLRDIFAAPRKTPSHPYRRTRPAAVAVPDDSLVVTLGLDPVSTLVAVETHKKPHVVLCHTTRPDFMPEMAGRVRDWLLGHGTQSVQLVPCDITGCDLPEALGCPEHPDTVVVSPTPGTKPQGAFLAHWGRERGCQIWGMEPGAGVAHLLRASGDTPLEQMPILAPDPLFILQAKGVDARSSFDAPDENRDQLTARQDALLDFMRAVCDVPEKADLLFRETVRMDSLPGSPELACEQTGKAFFWVFTQKGLAPYRILRSNGEWLERLAARAFERAGAQVVHSRVRVAYSEEQSARIMEKYSSGTQPHALDVDIIGSWGQSSFFVSCKAVMDPLAARVYVEAENLHTWTGRFTLGLVCHLGCKKPGIREGVALDRTTGRERPYEAGVIGWRDLCRPEALAARMDEMRARIR
ncbi:MAG: hypothetical protein Q4F72_08675, partial [Desulfovibrionaceae bacterium]|nr:hypothetical protein [Desulfovibrionaceae bacterium]